MPNYFPPLLPGRIYHLQSWSNGFEKLFYEDENYRFFLEKFIKYAYPVTELYSYSLQPDHFDLLIHIRNIESIKKHFHLLKPELVFDPTNASKFIMKCFSNMLNSYAKSFNKLHHRRGSVFIDYFRRIEIISNEELCKTIVNIHKSPVTFKNCSRLQQWRWSSFKNIIYNTPYLISSNKVLKIFGGKQKFLAFHKSHKKGKRIRF